MSSGRSLAILAARRRGHTLDQIGKASRYYIPRETLHRPLSARLAHGTRERGIIEDLSYGGRLFCGLAPVPPIFQFARAIRIPGCRRCT